MSPLASPAWSSGRKVAFRFLLLYALLDLSGGLFLPWDVLADWITPRLLGQPLPVPVPTGSGDTLRQYVLAGLYLVAAGLGTLIWSAAEGRRDWTPRLGWPAHTALRFWVAYTLLLYGWSKLLLMQMPAPDFPDLLTPLGEMSPMGLLWRSVGFSALYERAGGLAEVVAGLLLLSRRTSLFGALLGAGVMAYVFLLNLSFDVPVKLFSAHLLLYCLLLLAPFWPRLWLFVTNRPVPPQVYPAGRGRARLAFLALAVLAVALLPAGLTALSAHASSPVGHNDLAGVYEVQTSAPGSAAWVRLALGEQLFAAEETDSPPWGRVALLRSDGTRLRGWYTSDRAARTLTLHFGTLDRLFHSRSRDGALTLEDGSETLTLRPAADATLLRDRGFRWVNEQPFNR